jgi:hypothetical protein
MFQWRVGRSKNFIMRFPKNTDAKILSTELAFWFHQCKQNHNRYTQFNKWHLAALGEGWSPLISRTCSWGYCWVCCTVLFGRVEGSEQLVHLFQLCTGPIYICWFLEWHLLLVNEHAFRPQWSLGDIHSCLRYWRLSLLLPVNFRNCIISSSDVLVLL